MTNTAIQIRKQIIEREFSKLNSMQLKAVTTVNGPLLILAGAGSGKTTVIVNRIVNLIKYGNAYNSETIFYGFHANAEELLKSFLDGDVSVFPEIEGMLSVHAPKPWQILAITFTNKAANELKERLVNVLGEAGNEIWASTFHSACVRILRRYADRIGFTSHFTIYDTDDSKRVIKDCQRRLDIDEKRLSGKAVLNEISNLKDELVTAEDYARDVGTDARKRDISQLYTLYQKSLIDADAMDFDDIIVNTVRLLQNDSEVLDYYRNRFRYIMVDEYQDTNHAQYVLVSLLAGGHNNLCVVGDDDQSIYSFRGATIENILSFEEQFRNCLVIRLEENYRSTQNILDAANAVIANNRSRKGKKLWTDNGEGSKIVYKTCRDDMEEGRFVADTIMDLSSGGSFSDNAVLYRTNAQSNIIERSLVLSGIPYKIIGGHRFYDRKEIKDALAYLCVVSNPHDNVRLRRIINEPKRGIGETTVNNAAEIASRLGESLFDVMKQADEYAALSKSAKKLILFTRMIESFEDAREGNSIAELYRMIMQETGYALSLESDPATAKDRIENLDELYSTIARYEEENGENSSLEGFLEEVALLSDIDNYDAALETVTLMTLHSAKGLEFPNVFLVGMENGIFPSSQSLNEVDGLEEERRLAYVGITRAKKNLFLLNAYSRLQYGKTSMNPPSMFIREIPSELIDNRTSGGSSFYNGETADTDYSYSRYTQKKNPSYTGGASAYNGYSGGRYERSSGSVSAYQTAVRKAAEKKEEPENAVWSSDLKPGDVVRHKKFGLGLVISSVALGNDNLLEVAFEEVGTKKLMARIAKLVKEES